jgi:hypothetical protein
VIGTQRSIRALINTAYIERLQATFRARLTPLVRKTRAGAHKQFTLESGMWLVVAITLCGHIALLPRGVPQRWRQSSRIIAGQWKSC